MNKKLIIGATLTITICFLILGIIFKMTAKNHRGIKASFGTVTNGQYIERESGRLGENKEKYEAFNTGGTIFFILAGITGVVCIASVISYKKSK